jgi:hypothetical protein
MLKDCDKTYKDSFPEKGEGRIKSSQHSSHMTINELKLREETENWRLLRLSIRWSRVRRDMV